MPHRERQCDEPQDRPRRRRCWCFAACGKDELPKPADPATQVEQAARQMGEAARQGDVRQVGEAMKQMGEAIAGSVKVEPVDFRKLKELLPESIAGLKRVGSEGSRTNVMGVASSSAEATYEDGKGGRIVLEMKDVGTLAGVTAMAFAWLNVEIDKEGDSGYERTTTVSRAQGLRALRQGGAHGRARRDRRRALHRRRRRRRAWR